MFCLDIQGLIINSFFTYLFSKQLALWFGIFFFMFGVSIFFYVIKMLENSLWDSEVYTIFKTKIIGCTHKALERLFDSCR